MPCEFCGSQENLVRAHVIPEAFFKRLRKDKSPPLLIQERRRPARSYIGVYDKSILCGVCDAAFGKYDDYAQKLLSEDMSSAAPMRRDGKTIGYEFGEVDYRLLKLFFISLIWRASVSRQPFYKKVVLGPHEAIAKTMLESGDPGGPDDFGVVISHFDHPLGYAILDPHPERFPPGIRYTRFYLSRYIAYIKTDSQPAKDVFSRLQLHPDRPLQIVARDFDRSGELPLLYRIAAANHSLQARRP